jgi:signal transduction histidine kinase
VNSGQEAPAPVRDASAWRENVVGAALDVAAIVGPLLVAVVLFFSASKRWADVVVVGGYGALLPVWRFVPRLSLGARGSIVLGSTFVVSIYAIARAGLGASVCVGLAAVSVLAVLFRGRRLGYLLVGLAAVAAVAIGLLVTGGKLAIDVAELDSRRLTNWVRIALANALTSTLLVTVIDFVIRHVETSARATNAALEELRIAYGELGLLHGKVEAAKEEERKFIAHELHDELGQNLTALKLRLQHEERTGASRGNGDALAVIDQLIAQVRKLSGDLRPPLLDEVGLVPALRAHIEKQSAMASVKIDLEVTEPPAPDRLAPDLEIACFRVVQESLNNALRHASPTHVRISVHRDRERIALTVRDDGTGFETPSTLDAAASTGHLGVVGMRERVRGRGGTFRITSRRTAGTTVEAAFPVVRAPVPRPV